MNIDKKCKSSFLHSTHSKNEPDHDPDARVEVLLFLGIIFWCWLLILTFSKERTLQSQNSLSLFWNGSELQTGPTQQVIDTSNTSRQPLPAAMTPFFFQPIPVNFANAELIATISGIGPELADRIIITRNNKGFFSKPQDLLVVPGIGPSRMNQFAPQFSFLTNQ